MRNVSYIYHGHLQFYFYYISYILCLFFDFTILDLLDMLQMDMKHANNKMKYYKRFLITMINIVYLF